MFSKFLLREPRDPWSRNPGFRVWGLGWGLGFGFRAQGSGFGVWGLGFRVGLGFSV